MKPACRFDDTGYKPEKNDIWALGLVIKELADGTKPESNFKGTNSRKEGNNLGEVAHIMLNENEYSRPSVGELLKLPLFFRLLS